MHDICQEYTRKGSGALDKDLIVSKCADMRHILEEHKTIKTLVFTGRSAETRSGKRMEEQKLLDQYKFGGGGISKKPPPRQRPLSISVDQGKRPIQTFTVPSPSPRNVMTLDKKIEQYKIAFRKLV
jgi:hypothetical protein